MDHKTDHIIKILIADDHEMLRQGIKTIIADEPDMICAGEVSNGNEVLRFLQDTPVDVILMDINMPLMDGLESTKLVSEHFPDVRILALTMLEQGSFIKQMLKSGALGYLLKTAGKEEVVHAIRTVFTGKRYLGARATELLMDTIKRQVTLERQFDADLTRREQEVLRLIAEGSSDAEIAEKLHLSPLTVESHRKNVRHKLCAKNSAEMVRIAMERGLL
ncbi:MAG TPA: response regulator transcription factor [Saprospiraceae bacterium]|nr:response regulator transcription factor [Saprospiraceae bacterium]